MKAGIHQAKKEVLTQTGSNSGQTIMKTVARKTTEEVLIRTGPEAGKEVVKTGVREVSEEVMTQTVSQPEAGLGGSLVAGVLCAAAVEGVLMTRDIHSAYSDMKDGKIDRSEFLSATGKRVITGVGNVGGSTFGTVIGQALIPVPFVGGVVGAFVGGVSKIYWKHNGKFFAVKTGRPRTFIWARNKYGRNFRSKSTSTTRNTGAARNTLKTIITRSYKLDQSLN